MTVFDIEKNEGAWFTMDGGGRVRLRTIGVEDWKDICQQTVKKKVEYKRVEDKAERDRKSVV